MADEQPLLDKSRITGRAGDESKSNEQNSPNNSFNWRRYFGSEKNRREYEKLKNTHDSYEPGTTDKKNSVGLSKLFKFADGLDYILMLLSICLTTIQVYCIIANIVLFGQITGFFATQSFIIHCQAEHEGFIAVTTNQSNSSSAILTIPLICDRSFKLVILEKTSFSQGFLCCVCSLDCQNGTTLSATTTVQTSVLHLIRQKTMDTVHKLLGKSTDETCLTKLTI
ncbi:unnamed protein product [Adineta ricciae]|uniref:Uncharacterized protein n=1 Tax=Adineta ricciae TaxID=249248 RepID=A0A814AX36_ADIRI|nr:unnamed protein product [Adineta ricciae]